ncbi:hypothetical protein LCGC14_1974050 [marine sediment metagenome]|uniref:Uncharacterized protein n=1 Tax=marine sediment metagenome TaxID=412755 RepID=A0A0F9FBA1_9ZZZZ
MTGATGGWIFNVVGSVASIVLMILVPCWAGFVLSDWRDRRHGRDNQLSGDFRGEGYTEEIGGGDESHYLEAKKGE